MTKIRHQRKDIRRLDYQPSGSFSLDLEIFTVSSLRHRAGAEELRSTHRYAFYLLICVTRGKCRHIVDFKPISCKPGSLIVIKPGQAHNCGYDQNWDGWMILFRPEFLGCSRTFNPDSQLDIVLEHLQEHLVLGEHKQKCVVDGILKMLEDMRMKAPQREVHALLRWQLSALLLRLSIFSGQRQEGRNVDSRAMQRFKAFQRLVETYFTKWHQVGEYAAQIGCSEKSLSRATMEATGLNAKAFIASRVNLEAKRLLAHTDLSVTSIGEDLGFSETTNFVKVFKRETGCTPLNFRLKSASSSK
ncbi:MAG: helix-turn-helix transcriptional regulator [Acidobacteriota bacterium]